MDLRLLGLLVVIQCLTAAEINCPPDIPHGYFFFEENTDSVQHSKLYYACDEGYKPVTNGWWATITCKNGKTSSVPQCVENTTCFDPEIAHANYTRGTFTEDQHKLWIRCNDGYEDKEKRAIALCKNGNWETLPVCDKKGDWCGIPPQIPNSVIINQVQDKFSEFSQVQYVCQTGFELETPNSNATCNEGQWDSLPSCREKRTTQDRKPQGSRDPSPDDNSQSMFTTIKKCGSPPTVEHAFYDEEDMLLTYRCNYWYKLKGNRVVRCLNGNWTPAPTCEVDFCQMDTSRYSQLGYNRIEYIKFGTKVELPCPPKMFWERTVHVTCCRNRLLVSRCCLETTHDLGLCREMTPEKRMSQVQQQQ